MLTRKRLSIVSEMLPVREMDKIQLDLIQLEVVTSLPKQPFSRKVCLHLAALRFWSKDQGVELIL